jgi:hypothetical protein
VARRRARQDSLTQGIAALAFRWRAGETAAKARAREASPKLIGACTVPVAARATELAGAADDSFTKKWVSDATGG